MKRFGEHVRELRHSKGLTLESVGKAAGINKAYLSGVENGRVNPPSPKVVRGIAKALGVGARTLLLLAAVEKAPKEIRDDIARVAHQEI